MRQGPRALSRFSISDSDIHISCEEKDKPAFEPLQGNPAFSRDSPSRCPLPMQKQNLGPTHIHIAERILLLRCLWKVGIPLEYKPGNQPSCRVHVWYMELFLIAVVTSWSLYTCVFLWTLWSSIKKLKTPFLFELGHGIVLYALPGDRASSRGEGEVS